MGHRRRNVCVQAQGLQFACLHFLCTHMYTFTCVCVQCRRTMSRGRFIYLPYFWFGAVAAGHTGRSERGMAGGEGRDAGRAGCRVWIEWRGVREK